MKKINSFCCIEAKALLSLCDKVLLKRYLEYKENYIQSCLKKRPFRTILWFSYWLTTRQDAYDQHLEQHEFYDLFSYYSPHSQIKSLRYTAYTCINYGNGDKMVTLTEDQLSLLSEFVPMEHIDKIGLTTIV